MGILSLLRKNRRRAKAEIKAASTRAKAEVKSRSKAHARQAKLLARQEKGLLKAEQKGLKAKRKHERAMANTRVAELKAGRFNAGNVRRWLGAARLITPIALPLVYRLITMGQERVNEARAHKYGVSADQLAAFAGHGAPQKARIAGIRNSLDKATLPAGFIKDVKARLAELDAATDNAEYMTAQQRRRAHEGISRDIDQLTGQIQDKLRG
ncbi:DUF6474 family protein [Corynebacterium uberis]|uniref:DUF6474 family protein n=1 Tax=Corynebacterium TaxID=1716 RepID=UPI001D09C1CA|nr:MULTISPECIES: DUF6474 family protein [Corynebacterium]MCZ9309565.1 DUF6474 family protein [Corynebacterium sp. c6VSa_13]UDL73379.1 DUF6474 family protein [Corynebacterium uberis]UDL75742.1 DUF6474 family protein [Corynebacterium uberis]UDL77954.1 DUF6474 family protein [Corynebacterium uberis]UDL80238.1 DUF6474 family protein [Corynebacterium uberis]